MKLARAALAALDEKKGIDPLVLDVSELSNVTDYYVMVTGNSPPHVKALSEELHRSLKQQGLRTHRQSGTPDSGWVVMDYVDVVVHIFSPDARAYYALEELWSDARRVE